MNNKILKKRALFINSILFILAGITIIIFDTKSQDMFHLVTSLLIIFIGLMSFIVNLVNKNKIKDTLLSLSTYLIGLFFFKNKIKYLSLFPMIFGIYMLLNGTIKFITYLIFKNRENRNYYLVLLGSLIDYIFSYLMIKSPTNNIKTLTLILGLYLILYGITYLRDYIRIFIKDEHSKRRIRITPPIIFTFLIPYTVQNKINKYLDNFETDIVTNKKKEKENIDLEIFIHVSNMEEGIIGHADFCFENTIYSYGCYDEDSKKLFKSLGEGTLYKTTEREKYLNFCTKHGNKTIFSFGITLNKQEKEKIKEEIKLLEKDTYKWNPKKYKKLRNIYAEKLIKEVNAKFYKFKKTNYKTYFLLFTNCVKLVDDILGSTGSDLLKINGVITPGAYYEYLDKEFRKENSKVIKKQIYQNSK